MDYKDLFKMVDKFTAQDFQDIREAIQKVIDKNPKATYTDAKDQIEKFHGKQMSEEKTIEILKNISPQGFEDYDPRDFVSKDAKPKYKIVYDEMSCYNWGFSINDVWRSGEVENSIKQPEEDDELLNYLLLKLKEGIKRGTCSFKDLVECFQSDDTEFDKSSCDDCGHSGYRTTWNI